MTRRALLIGLLAALALAWGGRFNDHYMQQTYAVGNFLPISVIGFLLVLVLAVGPLLHLARRRWAFSGAELALIVILPLAVCVVPGSGFLRTFSYALAMPEHFEKSQASWQRNEVLSYVPDGLLVRPSAKDQERVLGGFLQGSGSARRHIAVSDVPWAAWLPALARWLPLFLVLMTGLIGLSLVLHRQWTTHEHLAYPIADFVQQLAGAEQGRAYPAVVRNRLFWYACVPILAIHLVNGLNAWYPGFVTIPHRIDLTAFRELFPDFASAQGAWAVFNSTIYFAVVAFAFFLPSDISLSLGLSTLTGALLSLTLTTYGVAATNDWFGGGEVQGLLFGAYLGLFGMVLYSGRAYYRRVGAAAFGRGGAEPPEREAVWGLRLFLAAAVAAAFWIVRMGLDWPYAILLVFLLVVLFTVMSRICAETGLFFLQPNWQPVGVIVGLLGAASLGPTALVVTGLVCTIVCIDPREAMMPFIVNGLRIAENARLPRGRVAAWMIGALAAAVVGGVAVALWLHYDRGAVLSDGWGSTTVPQYPFNALDRQIQAMTADGIFEQVRNAGWVERLSFFRPNRRFLGFLCCGLGLYVACAILRLRFVRWPLHPVLFVSWFTYSLCCFATSFLIGWVIKALAVRLGGGTAYQRMKPFMVGMIAGDLLGGLVFMVAGSVYYARTGFPPMKYWIFPG